MQQLPTCSQPVCNQKPKVAYPFNNKSLFESLYFVNCVAGLADRERQAHLQVWPHRGVGHTPGFTHYSAIPPHTQPSGKSPVGGVLF